MTLGPKDGAETGLQGASWARLGSSWPPLGRPGVPFGHFWAASWGLLGALGLLLADFGCLLGACWASRGASGWVFQPPGGILEAAGRAQPGLLASELISLKKQSREFISL